MTNHPHLAAKRRRDNARFYEIGDSAFDLLFGLILMALLFAVIYYVFGIEISTTTTE